MLATPFSVRPPALVPLPTATRPRCRTAFSCLRSAPRPPRTRLRALPAAAPRHDPATPGPASPCVPRDSYIPDDTDAAHDNNHATATPTAASTGPVDTNRRRLDLLALDVEYTHVQLPGGGGRRSLATWVCLVDRFGGVPLKTHISLPLEETGGNGAGAGGPAAGRDGTLPAGTRVVGGVPRSALVGAPPLERVRASLLDLLRSGGCRVLVGHGLTKDLRALGVGERATATLRRRHGVKLYDTMSYGKFRGRGGTARPLARLASELLDGRVIQAGGSGRHDPEEDARAVLDLYVRYVDYSYMVEYETARLLEEHRRRSAAADEAEMEVEEEEEEEGGAQEVAEVADLVHSAVRHLTDGRKLRWYGVYTEEQYQAQRQSEERARWAAGVRTLTGNQSQVAWEGSQLDPPALLSGVTVVIISPRKPVSVGTVARACGSFECEDLRIVMPRQESYITRHAKSASKGAQYILYRAGHYDSIAEATADCDVRIAFTRWAQASSPHVYKVDINGLTSHPAVQRVITQPLQPAASAAAAASSRPPSAPWSEAAAAAAAAAEARLASPPDSSSSAAASVVAASSSEGSGEDDEEEGGGGEERRRWRLQREGSEGEGRSSGAAGTSAPQHQTNHHQQQQQQQQQDKQQEHQDQGQRPVAEGDNGGSACSSSGGGGGDRPTGRPPRVALVFGREELGMSDEEVDSCEVCCSIPIGRLQESLSLSHAVSIALCGLYQARLQHLAAAGGAAAAGGEPGAAAADGTVGQAAAAAAGGAGGGGDPSPVSYKVDASTGAVRAAPAAATAAAAAV
ncbi:hypothetical protein PLESTM_000104700 [Pleodorina starrii]|nr:hypothetical protein PLESTM_000104700 [Pleodorina starrii]